jgi:hypothetical protein
MTILGDPRTIVGIDPTHDGVAFAVFEEGQLMDWGTWRADGKEWNVLDRLIEEYGAEVIVLEEPDAPGCERRARMRHVLRGLAGHASRNGLPVVRVARREVRDAWRRVWGVTRKQAAAAVIAELFPVIASIVPKPRKVYVREVPRARIFGTVALVLHAFGMTEEKEPEKPASSGRGAPS